MRDFINDFREFGAFFAEIWKFILALAVFVGLPCWIGYWIVTLIMKGGV